MHKCSWFAERILIIKSKSKRQENITSKGNLWDQYAGLILIMNGWHKISGHVKRIYMKKLSKKNRGQDMKIYPLFFVPIDNAKIAETIVFHPEAPVMKYHQNLANSCSLSGLASAFHIICDTRAATDLDNHIVESLTLQKYMFRNIIDFANDIRKKKLHNKVEHHLRYNLKRWNNKGGFEILNDMIENVTLV